MLPDWVSNPGPLTYVSGALSIALCGPAQIPPIFGMKLWAGHDSGMHKITVPAVT